MKKTVGIVFQYIHAFKRTYNIHDRLPSCFGHYRAGGIVHRWLHIDQLYGMFVQRFFQLFRQHAFLIRPHHSQPVTFRQRALPETGEGKSFHGDFLRLSPQCREHCGKPAIGAGQQGDVMVPGGKMQPFPQRRFVRLAERAVRRRQDRILAFGRQPAAEVQGRIHFRQQGGRLGKVRTLHPVPIMRRRHRRDDRALVLDLNRSHHGSPARCEGKGSADYAGRLACDAHARIRQAGCGHQEVVAEGVYGDGARETAIGGIE